MLGPTQGPFLKKSQLAITLIPFLTFLRTQNGFEMDYSIRDYTDSFSNFFTDPKRISQIAITLIPFLNFYGSETGPKRIRKFVIALIPFFNSITDPERVRNGSASVFVHIGV